MKISVLTPSYNSAKTIEKAIVSVQNQTYTDWEHIIVDGGSEDGTVETLEKFESLVWISERDKGQSDAMNKAFKLASGDIITYLNADDFYYPDAFRDAIGHFKEDPSVDMVVGNLDVERMDGSLQTNTNATVSWKDLSIIKGRFPLNPVSYFYKRKVQEKIGDFPLDEHYTMDYWFLLRAFYLFKPIKVEDNYGRFVFDGNNKTSVINSAFPLQRMHALKFAFRFTPHRLPYVYFQLLIHKRNQSSIGRIVRRIYKRLKKIL